MTLEGLKRAFAAAYQDVIQHHVLLQAAGLAYYFVLSIFPGLIFLSAILGLIPVPDLFGHVLNFMGRLLPPDTMRAVQAVLLDVLATNRLAWLSFATVGMIWAASAAFDAMIEALDLAYDVDDPRPFWKTRLLAISLAGVIGGLVLCALLVMIVGPRFGEWLAGKINLSPTFVLLWPVIHWSVAIVSALVTVELLYFLAPNVKQRFRATLPGATLAVACWISFSYLLGFYFRHIANFSRTYGALAGFIAFMTWFYWNSFALLVGAELNAELAKLSHQGQLSPRLPSSGSHKLGRAA